MRLTIPILFASIVTMGGCNHALEAFKIVEVGKPLPDKLANRLYRTDIGLGGIDLPPANVSTPRSHCYRSFHALTDDNGVVVGKALFESIPPAVSPDQDFGTVSTVTRTTILEVQIPPEWWNAPSADWGRNSPPVGAWSIPAVRKYLRTHPEKEQRAFIRQWKDWYQRRLDETSTTGANRLSKRSRRTVLDYLCLAAQLLEAVPVEADGSWDDLSGRDGPVARAPICLASFGQDQLDMRQVTTDGFKWQGGGKDLKVTCENLGSRKIRLEVVTWERLKLREPEDVIPDATGRIIRGMLYCLARALAGP
ncbi:MAG: hypothetical protein QGH60_07005 [Phycisphaerae bacterium]|nr:hypothetical protein [Phycisphaerae bacterium]